MYGYASQYHDKQELLHQYHEPKHEHEKKIPTYQPKTIFNMEITHKTYDEARGHSNKRPMPAQPLYPAKTKSFERHSEHAGQKKSAPRKKEAHTQIRDENGQPAGTVVAPDLRRATGAKFHKPVKDQQRMGQCEIEKGSSPASYQRGHNTPPLLPSCAFATPTFDAMACVNPLSPITPEPKKTNHRHTKSASKKLAEYIRSSADLLDETRRDIAGKLSPQFSTSFDRHTFSWGHRKNSVSSLDSFYCAGEAVPCAEQAVTRCRLCWKGEEGPRGLCLDCEEDHRPLPSLGSDCGSSDGRRTPRPKTYKYFSVDGREEVNRPSTAERAEEEVRIGYVASEQRVVTPTPTRQQVDVRNGDVGEDPSKDMTSWRRIYGSSDYDYYEILEPVKPLKITKKVDNPSREINFYAFYDDLL